MANTVNPIFAETNPRQEYDYYSVHLIKIFDKGNIVGLPETVVGPTLKSLIMVTDAGLNRLLLNHTHVEVINSFKHYVDKYKDREYQLRPNATGFYFETDQIFDTVDESVDTTDMKIGSYALVKESSEKYFVYKVIKNKDSSEKELFEIGMLIDRPDFSTNYVTHKQLSWILADLQDDDTLNNSAKEPLLPKTSDESKDSTSSSSTSAETTSGTKD